MTGLPAAPADAGSGSPGPTPGLPDQPGNRGDLRRRSLRHYVPLALAGGVILVLLMNVSFFDVNRYPVPLDIFTEGVSGALPDDDQGGSPPGGSPMDHGGGQTGSGSMDQAGGQTGQMPQDHAGDADSVLLMRRLATVTGYVALGLIGLTLLIGPVNLWLGRRIPVSSYLRRDIGILAAVTSGAHVIFGFLVKHGDGQILSYFLDPNDRSRILTSSFGLANWAGLAALAIIVGLAAISSDAALRKLKARRWKRLQRLNYLLFALVVLHAVLYGALWRETSPYTVLLMFSAITVLVGRAIGVRLWLRRNTHTTATARS